MVYTIALLVTTVVPFVGPTRSYQPVAAIEAANRLGVDSAFDSLAMDKVKQIAAIDVQVDSLYKILPDSQMAAASSLEEAHQVMFERIQGSPELLAAVKRGGLTPEMYTDRKFRILSACMYLGLKRNMPQFAGAMSPQPAAADVAFVEAHTADLKAAGYQLPQIQINGQDQ